MGRKGDEGRNNKNTFLFSPVIFPSSLFFVPRPLFLPSPVPLFFRPFSYICTSSFQTLIQKG